MFGLVRSSSRRPDTTRSDRAWWRSSTHQWWKNIALWLAIAAVFVILGLTAAITHSLKTYDGDSLYDKVDMVTDFLFPEKCDAEYDIELHDYEAPVDPRSFVCVIRPAPIDRPWQVAKFHVQPDDFEDEVDAEGEPVERPDVRVQSLILFGLPLMSSWSGLAGVGMSGATVPGCDITEIASASPRSHPLYAWDRAAGEESDVDFPDDVGVPIGSQSKYGWLVVRFEIINGDGVPRVLPKIELEICLTAHMRPKDACTMVAGAVPDILVSVPGHVVDWPWSAVVTPTDVTPDYFPCGDLPFSEDENFGQVDLYRYHCLGDAAIVRSALFTGELGVGGSAAVLPLSGAAAESLDVYRRTGENYRSGAWVESNAPMVAGDGFRVQCNFTNPSFATVPGGRLWTTVDGAETCLFMAYFVKGACQGCYLPMYDTCQAYGGPEPGNATSGCSASSPDCVDPLDDPVISSLLGVDRSNCTDAVSCPLV